MSRRAYNERQGFSAPQMALISRALGVEAAALAGWPDAILDRVAAWQRAQGLAADGMIGPQTLARMAQGAGGGQGGAPTSPIILGHRLDEIARQAPQAILGIDASVYQGRVVGVELRAAGCRFAILRASIGRSKDTRLEAHLEQVRDAGIAAGVYHVPIMCAGTWDAIEAADPNRQATAAGLVERSLGELEMGGWLDFEPDDSERKKPPRQWSALVQAKGRKGAADWVRAWRASYEDALGTGLHGAYLSPRIAREGGDELARALDGLPLWLALYLPRPEWPRTQAPGAVKGWPRWDIWQFRADDRPQAGILGGRAPGVDGGVEACDLNILNPASPLAALFV